MRAPRALSATLAVSGALALAGCGASPSQQVKAKVQEFAAAVRKGDYATICRRVLAPSLLNRLSATHIPCQQALRLALAGTNRLINEFASVAAEQSRQLTATMTYLRRATGAIDPTKVDSRITNLSTASANMTENSSQLKQTSSKIDLIIAKVDSGNGSAAKLLNDPGIYNDTRALLQRMDSLIADVKKNPKAFE